MPILDRSTGDGGWQPGPPNVACRVAAAVGALCVAGGDDGLAGEQAASRAMSSRHTASHDLNLLASQVCTGRSPHVIYSAASPALPVAVWWTRAGDDTGNQIHPEEDCAIES